MTIVTISNKAEHDEVVAKATSGTPTVIYVSNSATPVCRAFTPEYEAFADKHGDVTFAQMELDKNTSPMIKFGPQNAPILILLCKNWAKTLLGADLNGLNENLKTITSQ